MKDNKILVPILVTILIFVVAWVVHIYNKDKNIWWNSMHNKMINDKMDTSKK